MSLRTDIRSSLPVYVCACSHGGRSKNLKDNATLLQGEGATPIKQDVKKGKLRFYHEVLCRGLLETHLQGQIEACLTAHYLAAVAGAHEDDRISYPGGLNS